MTSENSPVSLSANAAKRINTLVKSQGNDNLKFRITINGGGCSGFQYDFSLVEDSKDDDLIVDRDGATMLVDGLSIMYLMGSEVDFTEELAGSMFVVKNPNATASCGCGSSFAV
ncbi:MAG: iron-sulfur cluster insertion protein ErpA [Kordiimonadaceae bacterium]|jgi:iron-sulfur cluster insertion protein|nr:iron-sulfur cluster insertion protein ErpA [Kordiimonadaceae bacterium]MDC0081972.1 iron-sulfur cluster insertion protein ErpA [Emcibacteraceae bacterium]MBT6134758.1 iron-sulfur cluster insertion protein ErpA [Kordiimonadaceae bacterium]MBT6466913.1 iron-sulfur cluster insertion protein ErpA [Kordiimonadaceae bacterium]MBT7544670.1 iron-sulfur cluster insertion protein ErpA [Kordiimonadaceae bacterium]|tara:strand:+ start:3707 stop:4048 length:342 start_codon:yes stop_codon:yes gene_type:complete